MPLCSPNPPDAKFDKSIGEQNAIAAMHFARKRSERGVDPRGIAENTRGRDGELLAFAKLHRTAARQGAGANFGSLKIRDNRQRFFVLYRSGAEKSDAPRVFCMRAVRKIQASDVHSGAEKLVNHFCRATGGADGANDFRVAEVHGCGQREDANSATMRASKSMPFGNEASGRRSSSPWARPASSRVSGNGFNP